MVVNQVRVSASVCVVHTLAKMVVPGVSGRAKALVASAAANFEAIIEVETERAWLFFTEARSALIVPELSTVAFLWCVDPGAVDFVPVLGAVGSARRQADAQVAPVFVVLVGTAVEGFMLALAPGLMPVETGIARLGVALASTAGTVPVETLCASVDHANARAFVLVPDIARVAMVHHLHTSACAHVESPVDVLTGVVCITTIKGISLAIDVHASAVAEELVPVCGSNNSVDCSIYAGSIWCLASAFAS